PDRAHRARRAGQRGLGSLAGLASEAGQPRRRSDARHVPAPELQRERHAAQHQPHSDRRMSPAMTHSNRRLDLAHELRDESGMALLIAVIVLLLMSALALSALQHAGDESQGSGSARRKDATLYAAESGRSWVRLTLENFYLSGAIWSSDI